MRYSKIHTKTIDIISSIFIFLFVYTSISKLIEFSSFRSVLSETPLIGFASGFISWFLPGIEILTAVFLFVPLARMKGLWLSFSLMILFTGYLAFMIFFTDDRPCNCGGVFKQLSWPQHLLLNLVLTTIAAFALWFNKIIEFFIAINRSSRTPVQDSRQNLIN